jgi:ketosteroid isomerase-like protein
MSGAEPPSVVKPADHLRAIFRAFDAKDVSAFAAFMTDDVRDGGEVTLPCCNVLRLRDGLVAEYRSYIDATPVYS